ncbi:MAG: formyltransferase family protein [Candidatus Gottesmanbacteria bacterium]|nr:formyltransferase family protein [Candidatus Gottesmanbacteria bacterium]
MKNKRLYFVLADENLFHPHYLSSVINNLPTDWKVTGITVLKEHYKKGFIFYLFRQYSLWGLLGFVSLTLATMLKTLLNILKLTNESSIERVAVRNNIPLIKIDNVNNSRHLSYLKTKHIDILISSCGQIFKAEILKVPKIACINRHTGLLPKYGGSLPVFWAMYNNEKKFGVSVHIMVEKIDEGDVISQEVIENKDGNTLFTNYVFGFKWSVTATLTALHNITTGKFEKRFNPKEKLYFRFPEVETIRDFRKKHITFSVSDATYLFTSILR